MSQDQFRKMKNLFYQLQLVVLLFAPISNGFCEQNIRIQEKFNTDWRFQKGELSGAEKPDYDDSMWREVRLPHDWSIEDFIPDALPEELPELSVVKGEWYFKKGDAAKYSFADCDHQDWQRVHLPATWEEHSDYEGIKIYGWYRKEIEIPDPLKVTPFYLLLGKISDVDETYLNGRLIGRSGSVEPVYDSAHFVSRRYKVTPDMLEEKNILAVRVFDGWNEGGIVGENEPIRWGGPFYSLAEGGTAAAFTVGGTAWYRKSFELSESHKGKQVTLTFEGVYMNSDVWINGHHLGNHPFGYTQFSYDLTPYLNPVGDENVVAVEVKNLGRNCRWYSGSGIYRDVWITVTNEIHFSENGIKITPENISRSGAVVNVEASIEGGGHQNLIVKHRILNDRMEVIASKEIGYEADETSDASQSKINVANPMLWDLDDPHLYVLESSIYLGDELIERVKNSFGIRKIEFDPQRGFLLNDKVTLLRGGCMHHDNGPLGAVSNPRAEERRVELMKANGFNAIRTAHNPPSIAFLDACDRVGMLVIDEAFDAWIYGGIPDDYSNYFNEWWERDLESMIMRDWNHPSIVMWSIGNEIHKKTHPEVINACRLLTEKVKRLDQSRPVTAGVNNWPGEDWNEVKENYMAPLDVLGYNYMPERYEADFDKNPDKLIYGSESFPSKIFEYWMPVRDLPYVIGDFAWTGYDYLGEVSIGWNGNAYPWTLAYCGDIDICGFKRPQSYYREVLWKTGKKVAIVVHHPEHSFDAPPDLPWAYEDVHRSWTWDAHRDKELRVDVYSSCEEVELFQDGESLGRKENSRETEYITSWQVDYEPGELKAVGYTDGLPIESDVLKSAGKPVAIKLSADRSTIKADGEDLSFVTVELVDARGIRHPFAEEEVHFEIEGEGIILALASANPMSTESFQQYKRSSFEGRLIAIIQSTEMPGKIVLKAKAEGLTPTSIEITSEW